MPNLKKLISVFEEARDLLADPDNNFDWSSWSGHEDALKEVDGILSALRRDGLPERLFMEVLFAPTGPIQEVSISSGWGETFLSLAERFDEALAAITEPVGQGRGVPDRLWKLQGHDTFSREDYPLPGAYETEEAAIAAAQERLEHLEATQPSRTSGGQDGIQDQVSVVRPDGTSFRVWPRHIEKFGDYRSTQKQANPSSPDKIMPRAPAACHLECSICSRLRDQERALRTVQGSEEDTSLPEAADMLEVVRDIRPGHPGLQLKRCPQCGTFYLLRSTYEFLIGFGGSYDEYFLTRLTREVGTDYLEGRRSEPPEGTG
jgi:hypothetical protein